MRDPRQTVTDVRRKDLIPASRGAAARKPASLRPASSREGTIARAIVSTGHLRGRYGRRIRPIRDESGDFQQQHVPGSSSYQAKSAEKSGERQGLPRSSRAPADDAA